MRDNAIQSAQAESANVSSNPRPWAGTLQAMRATLLARVIYGFSRTGPYWDEATEAEIALWL
jgi:hypothetical protein